MSYDRTQKFHTDEVTLPRSWCYFWLVALQGKFASANQKHYPELGSDTTLLWNFCIHFSNLIWHHDGNQWWYPKMLAVSQAIKWVQLHFLLLLQIHVYLIFCVLTVITSILMFWLVMPIIVNDNREVSWNMFFGSFLGLVAITFVVSMKGSFVAFKASFFQYNCCNKVPQLQVSESLQAQYREK